MRGHRRDPLIRLAERHEGRRLAGLVDRAYNMYVEQIGRRPAPMDDDYVQRIRHRQAFVAHCRGEIAKRVFFSKRLRPSETSGAPGRSPGRMRRYR